METPTRALALETSGPIGSLAAISAEHDQQSVLCRRSLPRDQRAARSLLPAVRDLLAACAWKPRDLDLVCTTVGPGSFTGLRLGVTTAKTLAYATGAELVGVSTLAAIAAGGQVGGARLWTILDAQRQELFACCFDGARQDASPPPADVEVVAVDRWLAQLRSGDLVAGPPLEKLLPRLPDGVEAVAPQLWAPRDEVVGQLGIEAACRGETVDAMQLVPRYYRKSAAEEKADLRQ